MITNKETNVKHMYTHVKNYAHPYCFCFRKHNYKMTDQVWPILSKMNLTAFAKLSLKQRTTDLEQRPLDRRDQVEILQA